MQLLNNVTRNTSKVTQYKYSDAIPLHWCNTINTILPQTTIILLNTATANHQQCYSMPIYTHQYQNWYSVYLTMLRCSPNWQRYCTDYCYWLLPPITQKHTRSAILWQSDTLVVFLYIITLTNPFRTLSHFEHSCYTLPLFKTAYHTSSMGATVDSIPYQLIFWPCWLYYPQNYSQALLAGPLWFQMPDSP